MKMLNLTILLTILLFVGCNSEEPISGTSSANAPSGRTAYARWPSKSNETEALTRLVISDKFTNDQTNLIEDMAEKWIDAVNNDVFFYEIPMEFKMGQDEVKSYQSLDDYDDLEMGIYKSTTWFPNASPFALAITQFFGYWRNLGTPAEHIELVHADIIMNFRDFNFSNNSTFGTYDFPSVVLHELGHFLGLPHASYFSPDVMAPTLTRQTQKRILGESDTSRINTNYAGIISGASALSDNQGGALPSASVAPPHPDEGKSVRVIHELRSDGTCYHYVDGKLIQNH